MTRDAETWRSLGSHDSGGVRTCLLPTSPGKAGPPRQSQPPQVEGARAPRQLLTPSLEGGRPADPCLVPTQGSLSPQCRCRPGFRLKDDGRTCADVDECSTTFPCSQRCINTHGSYKCLCVEGYAPRGGDPHSCKAVTGETGAWRVCNWPRQPAAVVGGPGEQSRK